MMASTSTSEDDGVIGVHALQLTSNPIRFEPVSKVTHVFLDDTNRQVFAVRSGGATGVVVKGPNINSDMDFRIEDKGSVISIKFSPDRRILAIQRSQSSVEFVNFANGTEPDLVEYSQICKGKTTRIQGFIWTRPAEIAFVTDHGLEIYQVVAERRLLKLLKTFTLNVNWFVYMMINALNERLLPDKPRDSVLLLSFGSLGNQLQPFSFKGSGVQKLPKFDVDLPSSAPQRASRPCLLERNVVLANIYDRIYVMVMRHQPRAVGSSGAEVALYAIYKDGPARKTDVLKLDMTGRFAFNLVDNLIVVHNQASKLSVIFDIGLTGESDGYVTYHLPVTQPLSITAFKLKVPVVPTRVSQDPAEVTCEMYSANWVVFQPNIVIDAKMGCFWHLELHLEHLVSAIPDKSRLVDFLLQREAGSKQVLLDVCRDLLLRPPSTYSPILPLLASVFDRLNAVYRKFLDSSESHCGQQASTTLGHTTLDGILPRCKVYVDQSDLYTHAFAVLADRKRESRSCKFLVAAVTEYIRSLSQVQIPVQHYLYEVIINTLVRNGSFYQLHQLLQYHVLNDSKPLACLLLSLEGVYPAAHQLALDMLKRLNTASEEIVEVLLSKQQLISALKFIRSTGNVDAVSARKFLEAAVMTDDPVVFYSIFNFFEQRNVRLRGNAAFVKGEHCDVYVLHYNTLFNPHRLTVSDVVAESQVISGSSIM